MATKHLAPPGTSHPKHSAGQPVIDVGGSSPQPPCDGQNSTDMTSGNMLVPDPTITAQHQHQHSCSEETPTLRRSSRTRRLPDRFEAS